MAENKLVEEIYEENGVPQGEFRNLGSVNGEQTDSSFDDIMEDLKLEMSELK